MRNSIFEETPWVRDAVGRIADLLPSSWRLTGSAGRGEADREIDGFVEITGPRGPGVSFVVEAKRTAISTHALLPALRDLARRTQQPVLFISDYVGPSLRAALAEEGISYADSTGWVRVVSDRPPMVLTGQGADRSPRDRQRSAVTRLNGLAASRILRALTSSPLPSGVRSLAVDADVSPGSVSKLLATLAAEGVVDRGPGGEVTDVRGRALIRRWASDYSFTRSNPEVEYFLAARGVDRALSTLEKRGRATLTGSAAARRLLPEGTTSVVPLRLLALYDANPTRTAKDLRLTPTDPNTANVLIAQPQDREIAGNGSRLGVAPPALVLADLLTLPGRGDAEAEQLMDALASDDPRWREL